MAYTPEQVKGDYAKYRDTFGLQHPSIGGSVSENGVRFTAQYVIALVRHGMLSYGEKLRIVASIPWKERGLLQRHQTGGRQDSVDNYIGLAVIANFCGKEMAKDVLEYGRKHWGFYNNENPGKKSLRSFLWRFPQLFAHLRMAAGLRPNLFQWIFWWASVYHASFSKDQDRRVLSAMLCIVANGRGGRITRYIVRRFIASYERQIPGGLGQTLAEYYKDAAHPDVKYLDKEYGQCRL